MILKSGNLLSKPFFFIKCNKGRVTRKNIKEEYWYFSYILTSHTRKNIKCKNIITAAYWNSCDIFLHFLHRRISKFYHKKTNSNKKHSNLERTFCLHKLKSIDLRQYLLFDILHILDKFKIDSHILLFTVLQLWAILFLVSKLWKFSVEQN